ncbi:uridine kinase [Crossiella equi]|uniref:Uridine kinase n=1 Tax=Crossiella equi TaxID=130796 RepID=A0ABS5A8M8_9PSEU|nr:uridine kinase [Crossiella equi]MBP2472938.1 uridine kinase [Crossiella equi]
MRSPAVAPKVVLLAGPSGSGKSHLAARLGWPVLNLDDFYRDGDDPAMPVDASGRADWDHPDSWNAAAALAAIVELSSTGRVDAPVYTIAQDRCTGSHEVVADGPFFLAEGLFADRLVEGCRAAGVLADGIVLAPNRLVTFARRLARDVAEARKPLPYLLRRGLRLMREQPGVVGRCRAAGLRAVTPECAGRELAALAPRPAAAAA